VWHELAEGWHYITESDAIRTILTQLALVSLIGVPYTVLMPIIAGTVLRGGPHTLGFLMGASGIGALASAISLALRRTVVGLGRMIAIASAVFGVGLIGLAISRHFWISLPLMLLTGFGMMQQMAASNTILQTIISDDKRGRVMSFYTLAVLGITPIGSLLGGTFAAKFGAPATLAVGGICLLAGALRFWRKLPAIRRLIRPIYQRLGILPEVAAGLQSATALETPPER
jgi:MFS family permease